MDTQNDAWEMVIPFEHGICDKSLGCTLPETNPASLHLKIGGPNTILSLKWVFEAYFQGQTVSFGECRGWAQRGQ